MKKLLSLSMAVFMIMGCAAGCGKDEDDGKSSKADNKYVGKWETEKIVQDGYEYTDFFGIPVAVMMQFDLKEDGTCTIDEMLASQSDEPVDIKGTWKADGDKVTIKAEKTNSDSSDKENESNELELEYKDGKLQAISEEEGKKFEYYLVKVDKFTEYDLESAVGGLSDNSSYEFDFDTDDSDE
ncbi:MAG: hypothetical protein K6G20_01820 [Ruminococcus sp.]|nr:hypothetical protein [Ruminococcus sp.]